MSRRRRAVLLLGLALLLGGLAAADVARREAALADRLGPPVPVVVARGALEAGAEVTPARVAVRRVPARFAPSGAAVGPGEVVGGRLAVPVRAGAALSTDLLEGGEGAPALAGAAVRRGERVAEVVARGSADLVQAGGRVDVLVTRDADRGGAGGTVLALEDVEVLSVAPAADAGGGAEAQGPRLAASLRVSLRQAVYLTAAEAFAREVRLLPRGAGDRRRGAAGMSVAPSLG